MSSKGPEHEDHFEFDFTAHVFKPVSWVSHVHKDDRQSLSRRSGGCRTSCVSWEDATFVSGQNRLVLFPETMDRHSY